MRNQQSMFKYGIYEFEDPSGSLICAKTPQRGTVALYRGTVLIVRPNQRALFLHKGKIADVFESGAHQLSTENLPLLAQLSGWKFGFKIPLRSELWFFTNQLFTGRRWGTAKPIIKQFEPHGSVPLRAFGNYNVAVVDPEKFYKTLLGSRLSYDISELEEFVQGQILELLPESLEFVKDLSKLNTSQQEVSQRLDQLVNRVLSKYGLKCSDLQILSILPSKEIMQALEAKVAMDLVGNKQEYLLYKAANSLNEISGGSGGNNTANDPMQMMLGLVLGKGLMGVDYTRKERAARPANVEISDRSFCSNCGSPVKTNDKFCSNCGSPLK